MKSILIGILFLGITPLTTLAQSGQSPVMQQSTSTTNTRQANPAEPVLKRSSRQPRQGMNTDTTLPKKPVRTNRKQRRLPPDSLRRGGATRVDTV